MNKRYLNFYFFFYALPFLGCGENFDTVRKVVNEQTSAAVFTLSTSHYLHTDENHVAELQKGDRSVRIDYRREVIRGINTAAEMVFTIQLYANDPEVSSKIFIENETSALKLAISDLSKERTSETVTVLQNPMTEDTSKAPNSVLQSQFGYLNFGQPVTATGVKRYWNIYRFKITLANEAFDTVTGSKTLKIRIVFGLNSAYATFTNQDVAAFKRFLSGTYDEQSNKK